jgi:hypothetical protein
LFIISYKIDYRMVLLSGHDIICIYNAGNVIASRGIR